MVEETNLQEGAVEETLQPRYPPGYWDEAGDYLRDCYILNHNHDYLEFLVQRVWRLDKPCQVVEFGCGYGRIGLQLMLLLPAGSSYTGIDQSAPLLERGRQVWAGTSWAASFHEGSVYKTPFANNSFDVAFTHTVLMHVPHPEKVIKEMIRVTRPGGLVITCEANRNAHTALLHIEETNHQEATPLDIFQTINRSVRQRTGVDHNIGVKIPVLMHRAGLIDVQARQSDAVRCLFPPLDTPEKERLFKAICDEGYGQQQPTAEQRARWKQNLVDSGVAEQAADAEIDRELAEDFLHKGSSYHTVYTTSLTWSFGTVKK